MPDIPHGTIFGRRVGNPPKSDAEHFIRCPACGGWIDCRDLGQVVRERRAAHLTATERTTRWRPRGFETLKDAAHKDGGF